MAVKMAAKVPAKSVAVFPRKKQRSKIPKGKDYDKCEQHLILNPKVVKFVGPFNRTRHTKIVIINLTNSQIVFQVRTTNWSLLRAYPVEEFLKPWGSIKSKDELQLRLQLLPFDYNPNQSYDELSYAIYFTKLKKFDVSTDHVDFRGDDPRRYSLVVGEHEWKKIILPVQLVANEDKKPTSEGVARNCDLFFT